MVEKDKLKNMHDDIHDSLCKIEETLNLLKDAKYIIANNKILGIRQKLYDVFAIIKELENNKINNENNKD